jgi:hypothetical protein
MTSSIPVVHVDVHVPIAATERVFLQLAVQAAARKFRELHADTSSPIRHAGAEIMAAPPQAG